VQNPYDDHIYSEISSLSRTPLSFHAKTKRRLSWGDNAKKQPRRRASSDAYASFLDHYPKLSNTEYVPWGEQEVLNILREGRAKNFSGHITVEMMQRLSLLLRRPLIRIAREAQRFSAMFRRCTRHDLQSAMKVILSRPLYDSCVQACMKAVALYNMKSGAFTKASKSSHCGLKFSVGRFHRWMLDAKLSCRIQEAAAIFLAACLENLLEEIVLRALGHLELGEYCESMPPRPFYNANKPHTLLSTPILISMPLHWCQTTRKSERNVSYGPQWTLGVTT
jgi:ankyrin repeat/BTB/POZ domain-containing protein 2